MPPRPPWGSDVVEWSWMASLFFAAFTVVVSAVSVFLHRRRSRRNSLSLRLKNGAEFKAEDLDQSEVEEIVAKFRDRMEAVHR
jgi:hypothetical protein